jgi:hypothetical protein
LCEPEHGFIIIRSWGHERQPYPDPLPASDAGDPDTLSAGFSKPYRDNSAHPHEPSELARYQHP